MVRRLRIIFALAGMAAGFAVAFAPPASALDVADAELMISELSDQMREGLANERLLNKRTRVALWPFREKDIPINLEAAEDLNNQFLARLKRDVGRKLIFVGRRELRALMADLEESGKGIDDPLATVSENATADVLIVGKLHLEGGSISLSYKALGASGKNMSRILAATEPFSFKLKQQRAAVTLEPALKRAARKLASHFRDLKELHLGGVRFQSSRIQTPFGRYVEQRASDEFADVYSSVISGRVIKVKRHSLSIEDIEEKTGKSKRSDNKGIYVLTGEYWDFGASLDLQLRLRAEDGRTLSWRGRVLPPEGISTRPAGNFPRVLLENDGLGPFRFKLWSGHGEDPVYNIGDKLNLMVRLDRDAWLYCFYRRADGKMLKILPNRFHESAAVKGGRVLTIPGERLPFDLNISEPAGIELVKCFAMTRDVGGDLPRALQAMDFSELPDGMNFRLPTIFRDLKDAAVSEASIVITVRQP